MTRPNPFITFYTPTFRRPRQLAACLASVAAQTAVAAIEQLVIPDHVGLGVGGMFTRVPSYVDAVHGRYVHILADDDILADPTVVEAVRTFADSLGDPPLILVSAVKGGAEWPTDPPWPPREGAIDLGCTITRADVWKAHVQAYGTRYEGDFDFLNALYQSGIEARYCPVLFMVGAVSRGAAEVAA